ncbi:hypothetical protein RJ639_029857 [Escallonia herrerae]|uniref:Chromatin target of PRMT1 protein C-terminal domain-containing protein n=1 Tax=Escallonia herrerae TaxID=1293975 RepID=A0AA88X421_9ASTE|nr:hypothetical protein RJ639_029857 [Escallonia herrerae]
MKTPKMMPRVPKTRRDTARPISLMGGRLCTVKEEESISMSSSSDMEKAGEFDSDEWMETLISGGDSTDSFSLQLGCDAWHSVSDFSLYATDLFSSCPSRLSITSSPPSDLNRVIFLEITKNPNSLAWAPSSQSKTVVKEVNPTMDNSRSLDILSTRPLLKALVECARFWNSGQGRGGGRSRGGGRGRGFGRGHGRGQGEKIDKEDLDVDLEKYMQIN